MIMAEGKIWTSVVITETNTQSNSTTETFNNPEIFKNSNTHKTLSKSFASVMFFAPPELFHPAQKKWSD